MTRLCDVPEQGVRTGRGRRSNARFASPAGRANRDGNEGFRGDNHPPVGMFGHGPCVLGGPWEGEETFTDLPSRPDGSQAHDLPIPGPEKLADARKSLRKHDSIETMANETRNTEMLEARSKLRHVQDTRSDQVQRHRSASESQPGLIGELESMIDRALGLQTPLEADHHTDYGSLNASLLDDRAQWHSKSHSNPASSPPLRRRNSERPPVLSHRQGLQKGRAREADEDQSTVGRRRSLTANAIMPRRSSDTAQFDSRSTSKAPLSADIQADQLKRTVSIAARKSKAISERAAAFEKFSSFEDYRERDREANNRTSQVDAHQSASVGHGQSSKPGRQLLHDQENVSRRSEEVAEAKDEQEAAGSHPSRSAAHKVSRFGSPVGTEATMEVGGRSDASPVSSTHTTEHEGIFQNIETRASHYYDNQGVSQQNHLYGKALPGKDHGHQHDEPDYGNYEQSDDPEHVAPTDEEGVSTRRGSKLWPFSWRRSHHDRGTPGHAGTADIVATDVIGCHHKDEPARTGPDAIRNPHIDNRTQDNYQESEEERGKERSVGSSMSRDEHHHRRKIEQEDRQDKGDAAHATSEDDEQHAQKQTSGPTRVVHAHQADLCDYTTNHPGAAQAGREDQRELGIHESGRQHADSEMSGTTLESGTAQHDRRGHLVGMHDDLDCTQEETSNRDRGHEKAEAYRDGQETEAGNGNRHDKRWTKVHPSQSHSAGGVSGFDPQHGESQVPGQGQTAGFNEKHRHQQTDPMQHRKESHKQNVLDLQDLYHARTKFFDRTPEAAASEHKHQAHHEAASQLKGSHPEERVQEHSDHAGGAEASNVHLGSGPDQHEPEEFSRASRDLEEGGTRVSLRGQGLQHHSDGSAREGQIAGDQEHRQRERAPENIRQSVQHSTVQGDTHHQSQKVRRDETGLRLDEVGAGHEARAPGKQHEEDRGWRNSDGRSLGTIQGIHGSKVLERISKYEQAAGRQTTDASRLTGSFSSRRPSRPPSQATTHDSNNNTRPKDPEVGSSSQRKMRADISAAATGSERSHQEQFVNDSGPVGRRRETRIGRSSSTHSIGESAIGSPRRRGRAMERHFEHEGFSMGRGGSVSVRVEIGISRSPSKRKVLELESVESSGATTIETERQQMIVVKADIIPEELDETSNED